MELANGLCASCERNGEVLAAADCDLHPKLAAGRSLGKGRDVASQRKEKDARPPLTSPKERGDANAGRGALKLTFSFCGDGRMRVMQKNSTVAAVTPGKLRKVLRKCLKGHKPLARNKRLGVNYETSDAKFLYQVPYVLVERKNYTTNKSLSTRKRTPKRQSVEGPTPVPVKRQSLLPIKIKMSPKFLKVTPTKSSKSPRAKPGRPPGSWKTKPAPAKTTLYTCQICDKTFKRRYKYKEHSLYHIKPDRLVINVERCKFDKVKTPRDVVQPEVETSTELKPEPEPGPAEEKVEADWHEEEVSSKHEGATENGIKDSDDEGGGEKQTVPISADSSTPSPESPCQVANEEKIESGGSDDLQNGQVDSTNDVSQDEVALETNGDQTERGSGSGSDNENLFEGPLLSEESGIEPLANDSAETQAEDGSVCLKNDGDESADALCNKRKRDELNETADGWEVTEVKFPPRKKVRFACDVIVSEDDDDDDNDVILNSSPFLDEPGLDDGCEKLTNDG